MSKVELIVKSFNLAYISSIFGKGTNVSIPLALEKAFFIGGNRLLSTL